MPNWCYTTYKCVGNSKNISQLHGALKYISRRKTSIVPNGFGKFWLGNLVTKLGGNWEDYPCRGEIIDYSLQDKNTLMIYQNTAWAEQEGVRRIIEERFPGVKVYYQEEDYSGVDYVVKRALKIALVSSIVLVLIFTLVPQTALTLYSVHDQAAPTVVNALRIFMVSFVGVAVTFLFTFYTQAIKRNKLSLSTSIIEGFVAPVGLLFILTPIMGGNGIWLSFVGAEVVTIIYIFIATKYTSKKTNGEYGGFFINKKIPTSEVLDLTVGATLKETVDVAQYIEKYIKDLGIVDNKAKIVSLSVEEILVNIININENLDSIDVLVKIQEEHILVGIKDQGIEFNPVIENDDLKFDNISVLNKIADKIDYSRVLGLNSTVITIKI